MSSVAAPLFAGPQPPALPYKVATGKWAAYFAMRNRCFLRWAWKEDVEKTADNLMRAHDVNRNPERESAGRNMRHVRADLEPKGWTVLDDKGRVCLCPTHERAMREKELETMTGGNNAR